MDWYSASLPSILTISLVIWIMSTNFCTAKTCIIDAVADVRGVSKWVAIHLFVVVVHLSTCGCVTLARFCQLQDICGIICAVMTWLLILYAEFVVMVVIIWPSPYPVYSTLNMIIFNLLAFLAYASHLRTMFSDPVSDKLPLYYYHSIVFWGSWQLIALCSSSTRAPCQKEMLRKKWFNSLASKRAKSFSNARNAAV